MLLRARDPPPSSARRPGRACSPTSGGPRRRRRCRRCPCPAAGVRADPRWSPPLPGHRRVEPAQPGGHCARWTKWARSRKATHRQGDRDRDITDAIAGFGQLRRKRCAPGDNDQRNGRAGASAAAQETQATAMHLAEAAEHQAQQITRRRPRSMRSRCPSTKCRRTRRIGRCGPAPGADRLQRVPRSCARPFRAWTHPRPDPETSKRIKRLGESSQENRLDRGTHQ